MSDLFGVGRKATAPPMSTMITSAVFLVVDTNIRCCGSHRGGVCGRLLALRAGRPHTHVCRGCGHRNDSEDGSWRA